MQSVPLYPVKKMSCQWLWKCDLHHPTVRSMWKADLNLIFWCEFLSLRSQQSATRRNRFKASSISAAAAFQLLAWRTNSPLCRMIQHSCHGLYINSQAKHTLSGWDLLHSTLQGHRLHVWHQTCQTTLTSTVFGFCELSHLKKCM